MSCRFYKRRRKRWQISKDVDRFKGQTLCSYSDYAKAREREASKYQRNQEELTKKARIEMEHKEKAEEANNSSSKSPWVSKKIHPGDSAQANANAAQQAARATKQGAPWLSKSSASQAKLQAVSEAEHADEAASSTHHHHTRHHFPLFSHKHHDDEHHDEHHEHEARHIWKEMHDDYWDSMHDYAHHHGHGQRSLTMGEVFEMEYDDGESLLTAEKFVDFRLDVELQRNLQAAQFFSRISFMLSFLEQLINFAGAVLAFTRLEIWVVITVAVVSAIDYIRDAFKINERLRNAQSATGKRSTRSRV
jgi:hypothetical protein